MAIKLWKLISNEGARKKFFERLQSIGNCGVCHKPVTDVHPDEVKMVNKKPAHDECYFEKLGEEIEKHPLILPSLRRGRHVQQ